MQDAKRGSKKDRSARRARDRPIDKYLSGLGRRRIQELMLSIRNAGEMTLSDFRLIALSKLTSCTADWTFETIVYVNL